MAGKKDKKEVCKVQGHGSMTNEDIKKLADDMYKGLIFTDRHVHVPEDVPRVFLPLILLDEKQRRELEANPPGMIYEYMENASRMGINGMPIFFSFKTVSQEDTKKVMGEYNEIIEAVKKA